MQSGTSGTNWYKNEKLYLKVRWYKWYIGTEILMGFENRGKFDEKS